MRRRGGAGGRRAAERRRGYEPIYVGDLSKAAVQEGFLDLAFAIVKEGGMGPFFYKFAAPAEF